MNLQISPYMQGLLVILMTKLIHDDEEQTKKTQKKAAIKKSNRKSQFPHILKQILDNSCTQNAICWDKTGTQIIIKDRQQLSTMLPQYFKHANIQSFFRQLNIFQFKSTKNEFDQVVFHNPEFSKQNYILQRPKFSYGVTTSEYYHKEIKELLLKQTYISQALRLSVNIYRKLQKQYIEQLTVSIILSQEYRNQQLRGIAYKNYMVNILNALYEGLNLRQGYGYIMANAIRYHQKMCEIYSKAVPFSEYDQESVRSVNIFKLQCNPSQSDNESDL